MKPHLSLMPTQQHSQELKSRSKPTVHQQVNRQNVVDSNKKILLSLNKEMDIKAEKTVMCKDETDFL